MSGYTTELKVGVLTIVAVAGTVWAIVRTDDKPAGAIQGYTLYAIVPSAEGLYPSTQVKMAGVSIGSVVAISFDDLKQNAKLELQMSGEVELSADSVADLRSEGLLGDRFIRVTPGAAPEKLGDGATIKTSSESDAIAKLEAKADVIATRLDDIASKVQTLTGDPEVTGSIKATLQNLEVTSTKMREIAEDPAIKARTLSTLENLDVASARLRSLVDDPQLASKVNGTLDDIRATSAELRAAAAKLDEPVDHVNSILAKVDAGEGTVGRLLTDSSTIDKVNSVVDKVDGAVSDITGMRMDVTYDGAVYFGSNPTDPDLGYTENPMNGEMKNTLGVRVLPREDYGYIIGLTSHPYGDFEETTHLYSETGGGYTELVQTDDLRMTFQFMKRWGPAALRFGMKEGGGGVGADLYMAQDRLTLTADLYDFDFASWPVLDGTPNLTLGARATPWRSVYVGGGLDNVIFGAKNGYVTGFLGFGFWFTD